MASAFVKKEKMPDNLSGLPHLMGGFTGGIMSTLVLHPLDLIKVRFSVDDVKKGSSGRPKYHGIINAFQTVYKQEGVRGLYRGATPNIVGNAASWGMYLFIYNKFKIWMQNGNQNIHLGPWLNMLGATQAGILTLVATNPIWVVKTRLCLQYGNGALVYKGMMDAFSKIIKREGVAGLYKGFIPGIFGISHGALQIMIYEEFKARYSRYYNRELSAQHTTMEYLLFSALSKLIAVVVTYPYQVVRIRLQDQHTQYKSIRHCIQETWKYNGLKGFYFGLKPNCIRVVPATALTFVVYENVSRFTRDIME